MGQEDGGTVTIAVSANQKLIALSIDNGTILVYETEYWDLIRIFEGQPQNLFVHLEFSSDNTSQLLAISN